MIPIISLLLVVAAVDHLEGAYLDILDSQNEVDLEDFAHLPFLPMQNPDLFEGDIMGIDPHDRNAIPYDSQKWTNNVVPYVLDASVLANQALILQAMLQFQSNSCIQFIPRTIEPNFIRIYAGNGCWSYVGMTGGQQDVSLGDGCMYIGTIVHELMHAVGFWHEHSRVDRDTYLNIYLNNVMPGQQYNFDKLQPNQTRTFGSYDYYSIMHYGEYAFSFDGLSRTMQAKQAGVVVTDPYNKPGFTAQDISKLKTLYC